eukprot:CAMPEP_0172532220 /NCGR_PEP_ID=MMETSP1067-20121228/5351_1 /TAXON_ID=265564 ORGANISM="Thalassiosira punctigera, Strain Tpunct2005C2" /NCGR_SAMPLE_ID=MMETSP1067 /ASSEMBLY_ACC=CAM_ASM_000444 /LENGTH=1090 /DNA_ID=CAMNT_0013316707 /DNA_START=376 /DNA_END=3648 /DNA_ORIENTATION=-
MTKHRESSNTDETAAPKMTTRTSTGSLPAKRDDENSFSDDHDNANDGRWGRRDNREQGDEERDPHDDRQDGSSMAGGARSSSRQDQRDGSPPTPEKSPLPIKTDEGAYAGYDDGGRTHRKTLHNGKSEGSATPTTSHHAALGLAVATSFDQVMGPSTSFGGLSALGLGSVDECTVTATNATSTPTHPHTPIAVVARGSSTTPGGTPGTSHVFRHSGGGPSIPANLPMSELDNPSWDLLNQDSFGFNLLDSQGSLSFETGEDAANKNFAPSNLKEVSDSCKKDGGSGRKHGESVDLTSAVTASLDDAPHRNAEQREQREHREHREHRDHRERDQWSGGPSGGPNAASNNGVSNDTTVVNSMNHNWVPPHSPPQPPVPHHHHYQPAHPSHHYPGHHPSYPAHGHLSRHPSHHHHSLQESRSDVTQHHSHYGMADHTEMRDSFEDPFKYAFGDPHASANAAPAIYNQHPSYGKSRSKSSSGGRRSDERGPGERSGNLGRSGRTSSSGRPTGSGRSSSRSGGHEGPSSRRSKKRKHSRERQHQEPLDGQHSPPPLPTIESAPTATLEMIHQAPSQDRSWSNPASPETRRRSNSSRNHGRSSSSRRSGSSKHQGSSRHHHVHPDVGSSGRSSTWHAAPTPPAHGYPPYPHHPHHPAPPPSADAIHSAFLPPMPSQQHQPGPPPPSSSSVVPYNPNDGSAPPREVYITTSKSSSGKSTMPRGAPPPYAMYPPPPPYNYPPAPAPLDGGRSSSNAGGGSRSSASVSAPTSRNHRSPNAVPAAPSQPPPPQQTGIALLTLPTGQTLSRSQAPGIGWPPEEDLRLTEVMSNHKSSQVNWDQLCMEHGMGRTARECHDRWTRYLKPGSRKGQWREEEDAIVLRVIFSSGGGPGGAGAGGNEGGDRGRDGRDASDQHPPFTQWADLAPQLPGRTGKQIRDRWVNYLNPAINHLPFSREDDLRLWRGHKELGKRWVEISVKIFHSTRSENHIKNRWYSAAFKKFIAKEFGMDAYVDAKQAQGGVAGVVASGVQHHSQQGTLQHGGGHHGGHAAMAPHHHHGGQQQPQHHHHPPGSRRVHSQQQAGVVHHRHHQGTRNGMLGM